jgi:hypothetical protein
MKDAMGRKRALEEGTSGGARHRFGEGCRGIAGREKGRRNGNRARAVSSAGGGLEARAGDAESLERREMIVRVPAGQIGERDGFEAC